MNLLARVTLWLAGLGFLGFGVSILVAPQAVLAGAAIEVGNAAALVELRAFYGGLEIGLGLLLLLSDRRARWRRPGLCLVLAAYGGIAAARIVGMWVGQTTSGFIWIALATELLLAAMAAVALFGTRQDPMLRPLDPPR
jgi:hypothetical protein